ncbi:gamma-glutamyl-gamma-aminobutyrate hydrolase family protein [Rhodococcus sp. T2V]|uniref:gamma-glutamyl-gamma-aminobutyrate hydrolase family protein n=1 Tax=Rhodococcus sp. T2V TaxID=3034164 RepID=UPI0023E2A248|nr:gamma-glutamyl-gamma-aminobutyrate hydrolase family protein [Rhodococcus sp. T2V]MDF3309170.1 gamma-glutamyl-gamma-aminobutyrate hydrolase family protein [Rhodococcus sp. T2V]
MKPLIAITGRRISATTLAGLDPRWAPAKADMFWAEFGMKVTEAGGIPVQLPYESAGADVVNRIDALIVTGGQDIDPQVWGGPPPGAGMGGEVLAIDRQRDDYEISLVRHALERDIPVLGICRGHQVLNVALGGTLVPHLTETTERHLSQESVPDQRPEREHPVTFLDGTLASHLYGERCGVNSWHHQAVAQLGAGLVASGHAPDGVVEAIELPGHAVLGVQWHPEASVDLEPCFPWLVEQARARCLVGECS